MGQVIISGSGGAGVTSDDATAIAKHVVKGKTYIGADTDDEIGTGTLELTGGATDAHVLEGNTFYTNDPYTKHTGRMANVASIDPAKSITYSSSQGNFYVRMTNGAHITNASSGYPEVSITSSTFGNATTAYVYSGKTFTSAYGLKLIGAMTINSLTSFSVAVSSDRTVTLTWTVPTAATGKPFSGVHVRYSTSSAPTSATSGTAIYTGTGSSTTAGSKSTASVTMPAFATKYYFSAFAYVTTSAGTVYDTSYKTANCTTASTKSYIYKSSSTLIVPSGFKYVDSFCVGGGGAGGSKYGGKYMYGGGGGGGYTATTTNTVVTSGQTLTITIGNGGSIVSATNGNGGSGGTSKVVLGSTAICTAAGGAGGSGTHMLNNDCFGGNGGSGGGTYYANGGTNGGNGSKYVSGSSSYGIAGTGQGKTTRAWGGSSGTAYSGGGGGGGNMSWQHENDTSGHTGSTTKVGFGGATGGGKGAILESDVASGFHHRWSIYSQAVAGTANTGGGGGGGCAFYDSDSGRYYANGAAGGSGIVLLKFHN